ncbi:MAG: hypothetical protein ACKVP2_03405 [Burkholderiales bacterium]
MPECNKLHLVRPVDYGDVVRAHQDYCGAIECKKLEIDVHGPGQANRLIMLSGTALPRFVAKKDRDHGRTFYGAISGKRTELTRATYVLYTSYVFSDLTKWANIYHGNTDLIQSTYVTLASIGNGAEDRFQVSLEAVKTTVQNVPSIYLEETIREEFDDRTRRKLLTGNSHRIVIEIDVAISGQISLGRVGYQVHFLVKQHQWIKFQFHNGIRYAVSALSWVRTP